jgi:hypothetical protein
MPEQTEAKNAAPPEPQTRPFHEETIKGQGFSQYDRKTGWIWVGIHAPSFTFRSAWAFIRSQEFMFTQAFDVIDNERAVRASLAQAANGKGPGFMANLAEKLKRQH